MSENNHNTGDDSDWLRHAIVGDKIRIAQLENEIKQLREKETALLAAGDKLEQQLVTVAQQRDALRLTDAERKAIEAGIAALRPRPTFDPMFVETVCANADEHADSLRGLLERLK